jgi:hypothetical protein
MITVRRTLARLALVITLGPVGGCTFGVFPRESQDPALRALPPCFTGDFCGVPFDSAGFSWTRGVVQTASGR